EKGTASPGDGDAVEGVGAGSTAVVVDDFTVAFLRSSALRFASSCAALAAASMVALASAKVLAVRWWVWTYPARCFPSSASSSSDEPVYVSGVLRAGLSSAFARAGMTLTRSVLSSTLATVMSTVRPARSGMSSTNMGPPYRGACAFLLSPAPTTLVV